MKHIYDIDITFSRYSSKQFQGTFKFIEKKKRAGKPARRKTNNYTRKFYFVQKNLIP